MKLKIYYLLIFMICTSAKAQQLDTIYFFDYYTNFGAPWNPNSTVFNNKGTLIIINKTDSFLIRATGRHTRMRLTRIPRTDGFIYGRSNLKIEGIRIIKPVSMPLEIQVHSQKSIFKDKASLDTVFYFENTQIQKPYFFINFIEHHYGLFKVRRLEMQMSNRYFAFKDNYTRPRIVNSMAKAIKYEYRLPEKD
jgi:hypothetical protein